MKTIGQGAKAKKVFFILSSLTSGGSERVFWNLAQGFNKDKFDVTVVLLDSSVNCFSTNIEQVRFIDLQTVKASKSFFSLYRLLKAEKPDVVFSTTDHINILVSFVARFIPKTRFIARASNIPTEQILYDNFKSKFYTHFSKISYSVFHKIVCQTEAMRDDLIKGYSIRTEKAIVIPNPVCQTNLFKETQESKTILKLIVVARFSPEKGLERLIDILATLPDNYHLSMVGIGNLQAKIVQKVTSLNLNSRVQFYGEIQNVQHVLLQHDLMVLSSYTEGFPNVVLEALAVGLPVVSFNVSGIVETIKDGFNGFIVPQNDLLDFKEKVVQACTLTRWDFDEIKNQVLRKFDLGTVSKAYEQLIY